MPDLTCHNNGNLTILGFTFAPDDDAMAEAIAQLDPGDQRRARAHIAGGAETAPSVIVSAAVHPSVRDALDEEAAKTGATRSAVARGVLERWVEVRDA